MTAAIEQPGNSRASVQVCLAVADRSWFTLAGLKGRRKESWRKTTVVDPGAERARHLIQRHFGPSL